jgi:suppressor of ftsI/bilirubin oxidase
MQRRSFLVALAAAFLAGRAPAQHAGHAPPRGLRPLEVLPPLGAKFSQPLRIPGAAGMMAWRELPGLTRLQARISPYPIFSGGVTPLWVYEHGEGGAKIANPTLKLMRGAEVDITLANRLGDDTTIHWHGLVVDEANDGSGLHPVRHEAEFRYRFKVHNRAGLYWYHAHPHFRTGEQVHKGLAGLLLVDDGEDQALRRRLGLEFGVNDLALMIADKQLGRANAIKYGLGEEDWIGDRVVVNWVPEPYFEATPRLYRLRILNAANARVFRLAFLHRGRRLSYTLIGTDGGLLERPQRVDDLFLGNAQRVDVLLDLSGLKAGDQVLMTSPAYDPMENEGLVELIDPMLEHPGATPVGEALDLMQIRIVEGPQVKAPKLPKRLSRLPKLKAKAAKTVRPLKLWVRDDGRWLINDWNFHLSGHDPVFTVQRGTQEIWEFNNAMRSMPHAMHTHGVQFRVLERRNSPKQVRDQVVASDGRTAHDLGLLDTVLVWPGETVRVLLDFSLPFPGTHRYMLHCHNLEHEDQGMMVTFAVGDEAAPAS